MHKYLVFFIFVYLGATNTAWAKQCQEIQVAGSSIWYPYAYLNGEGKPTGIAYDLATEILEELNIPIVYRPKLPWLRLQKSLTKGTIDILVSNHWTEQRAKDWQLTEEIAKEKLHIFTNNPALTTISSWHELKGYNGVVSRGTALGERYQSLKSALSVLEVLAHQEAFTMLNRKRADYILLTESAAKPYLAQAKNAQIKMSTAPLESYSIRMSFSRKSACAGIFSLFNEKLKKKIANGRVQVLSSKYDTERLHELRL